MSQQPAENLTDFGSDFDEIQQPELSAGLERLAQRGQAALQRFATAQEAAQINEPEVFLTRLRKFLHRLGG